MSHHLILGKHSAKSYWQMQVFTGQILLQATLFHASQETVLIPVVTVKVCLFFIFKKSVLRSSLTKKAVLKCFIKPQDQNGM